MAAKCFRPSRAGASKLPGASFTLRAWPLPQTEGRKAAEWLNPGLFSMEADQGETLWSWDFVNPFDLESFLPLQLPPFDS
jgi:hypothetical protein